MLGFALARRGLNESFHLEYVLRKYDDPKFGLTSKSNLQSIPGILERLIKNGVNVKHFQKAVEAAATDLGMPAQDTYVLQLLRRAERHLEARQQPWLSIVHR